MKIIKKKHSKKLSFSFAFFPIYLRCSCTVNTSEESVHWLVLPSKSRGAFSAPWSSPLQDHRKTVPARHRGRETFSTGVWEGVTRLHLLGHSPTSASEPDSLSASPPAPSGTHGTSLSHQRLTPPKVNLSALTSDTILPFWNEGPRAYLGRISDLNSIQWKRIFEKGNLSDPI